MSNTFRKEERLHNFHTINELFNEGKTFIKFPFKVVYLPLKDDLMFPAQVIMSVSKKKFKRANKRNLIRRRMKESYRLNKETLYEILNTQKVNIAIAFIYLPSELLPYHEIDKGMKKVIEKFSQINLNE